MEAIRLEVGEPAGYPAHLHTADIGGGHQNRANVRNRWKAMVPAQVHEHRSVATALVNSPSAIAAYVASMHKLTTIVLAAATLTAC
jgi:hypothetical protein